MKNYDNTFALMIVKNAMRVPAGVLNEVPDPDRALSNKLLTANGSQPTPSEVFTEDCLVSWVELYHADEVEKGEKIDAVLLVTDLEGNEVDYAVEKPAKLAAIAFRVAQIQKEYGITGPVTDYEIIANLLERVWNNEWMGQFNFGRSIYFSELADLLNVSMGDIWSVVDELVTTRKADILPSSWILVAPEGDEPRRGKEERAGHKKFSSSDSGWWSCSYCEQNGDDYSNPEEFPCSKAL